MKIQLNQFNGEVYFGNISIHVGDIHVTFHEKCCYVQLKYFLQTDDGSQIISIASSYCSDLNELALQQEENSLCLELDCEQIFNGSANALHIRNLVAISSSFKSIPPGLPLMGIFIAC